MTAVEKFLTSLVSEENIEAESTSRSHFTVPDLDASFRKKIHIACDKLQVDQYTRHAILARALQLPNFRYLSTRMIVIVYVFLSVNSNIKTLRDLANLKYEAVKPYADPMGVTKIDTNDLLRAFFQYCSMFIPMA